MRHPRRRGRKETRRQPRQRSQIVLPPRAPRPRARIYLGPPAVIDGIACPKGTVVVWVDGLFRLRDPGSGTYHRTFARPPRGLQDRIDKALRKGKTHG